MNTMQIMLVQDSFSKVLPMSETVAQQFYEDLFETAPEVKPYFANADMTAQGRKLMTMLSTVVNGLRDLDMILPAAEDLAVRHVEYGVQPDDYQKVGASLIRTLENGLGDALTPDVRDAWSTAYAALSGAMIDAAYNSREAAQ